MWDGDPTKFGLQGGDGYRRGVLGDLIKAGLLQQWHVLTDPLSGSSVEVMLDFKGGEVYELTARFGRIGEGVERRTLAELNRGGRIFGYARIDTPVDSPVVSTADVVEIMPGSDAQAQEEGVLNTNWLLSLFRSLIRDAGRSGPG